MRLSYRTLGLTVVSVTLASGLNSSESTLTCGDFLQQWDTKPKVLSFSSCQKHVEAQVPSLVASYWVPGKDAATVEQYLIKHFRMAPLRFVCCGWENGIDPNDPTHREGIYKDNRGQMFSIAMFSDETITKDWTLIPKFHVRVTTYLGDP